MSDTKKYTMDDFIEKIKSLQIYSAYEELIKAGRKDSAKFLEATSLVFNSGDAEFKSMVSELAISALFNKADKKLRKEILKGEKTKNAD